MADFGIGEALLIGGLLTSAASTAVTMTQANAQAKMANQTAEQNNAAAARNYESQIAANNSKMRQEEEQVVAAKAAQYQRAQQQLGTLRVMASEMGTGLATAGAEAQQVGYGLGNNIATLDKTYGNEFEAGMLNRAQAGQTYTDTTTSISNALDSQKSQLEAQKTSALISGVGSGITLASNLNYQQKSLAAQEKRYKTT